MLTEVPSAAAASGTRRFFQGDALELVVWSDGRGIRQYQLRYRHGATDGVFEWRRPGRLYHYALDDGEGRAARVDASPVLAPDGPGDLAWVRDRFDAEAGELEPGLRAAIARTLAEPDAPRGPTDG
jgi:hypothetical protein